MRVGEVLAHNIILEKTRLLREYVRGRNIAKRLASILKLTDPDSILPNMKDWSDQEPLSTIRTIGLDYSTDDLVDEIIFGGYIERLNHIDTYLGLPTIIRFTNTSGHDHRGETYGYAPQIPARFVDATGDVGGNTMLAEHVTDDAIHVISSDSDYPYALYENYEENTIAATWDTIQGTVSRIELEDDTYALDMSAGTIIWLKTAQTAFSDGYTLEFDLWLDPEDSDRTLQTHFRVHDTSGDTHITSVITSADADLCGIYDAPGMIPYATGSPLSNTNGYKHMRVNVYGNYVSQWLDIEGENGYQVANVSGLDPMWGYLYLYAEGHVRIRNLHISRYRRWDVADLTDLYGTIRDASGSLLPHAYTHNATGVDPLDVGDLADSEIRMLTAYQKQRLLEGGPGTNLHTHADYSVFLTTKPNGDRTLYDHVRNAIIHGNGLHGSHSIVPGHISPYDKFTIGEISVAANRSHSHVMPCWFVETQYLFRNLDVKSGIEPTDFWVLPEYFEDTLPTGCDPAYSFYKNSKLLVPTLTGKLGELDPQRWTSASSFCEIEYYDPSYVAGIYSASELYRYRLPVENLGESDVSIMLLIPWASAPMWITVWNDVDGLIPYPGVFKSRINSTFQIANITLRPGINDIIAYWWHGKSITGATIFSDILAYQQPLVLIPIRSDYYYDYGVFVEDSIVARGDDPYNDGIVFRPLSLYPVASDPAFLDPAKFVSGVR